MMSRILFTSKPRAGEILMENFTRSFSSRWVMTPRNFSKNITRCRRAATDSSHRKRITESAMSAISWTRARSMIPWVSRR